MQRSATWMVIAALLVPAFAWSDDHPQPGIRLPATLPPLADLPASDARVLGPGSRVQVVSTVAGKVRGSLGQIDEASLTLQREDGGAIVIPRTSIVKVDVSLGRTRQTKKGMLIGLVSGAVLGGALLLLDSEECSTGVEVSCQSDAHWVGSMALAGVVHGAWIGALVKGDQWASVTIDAPTLTSSRGRAPAAGLAFHWRF
jgi:hypothetical protein